MDDTFIYPRAFSHIGLSVTNIDQAIEWYQQIFGLSLVAEPSIFEADDSPMGEVIRGFLGKDIQKFKKALLSCSNGIGIELFEFISPKSEQREVTKYWKEGLFHFSIVDPNIETLAKRIAANGGRQRSKIWEVMPGTDYKMVYCEDPDGNIIEIYSHSTERAHSNI